MLPEPNSPVRPDEFIGRQAHLEVFREALRPSAQTGRTASFAFLGDWGIGKSSLLLKLAVTCTEPDYRMLPVTLSITKDMTDYMRFAEALCDRLANALLDSESFAVRTRAEIENWTLTKVSVGPLTLDRQARRYFLSSGSALLRHDLIEAWEHFIRPAYASTVFFLDDLHNLATPTVQDAALIIGDQFQSFGIEGLNLSVCFSAKRDYFSGIRSFAEPAVRFYHKCALEPFSPQETIEYTRAVFDGTGLDSQSLAEWLYGKTLGHPYFLAFISRELWSHYHARPFANAMHVWPVVFSRLEQGKFNKRPSTALRERNCAPANCRAKRSRRIHPRTICQDIPASILQTLGRERAADPGGTRPVQALSPSLCEFLRQQRE